MEMSEMKKILLRGYYGFGNFGDDLLLLSSHSIVGNRFPGAKMSVFSNNLASSKFEQPYYRDYINDLIEGELRIVDWRDFENFDLEVMGGGGVFQGGGRSAIIRPLNSILLLIGAKRTERILFNVRKLLGRKRRLPSSSSIAFGIGIDSHTSSSKNLMRNMEVLGSIQRTFVRDSVSSKNAEKLSVQSKIGTDLVFALTERFEKFKIEHEFRSGVGIVLCAGKAGSVELINSILKQKCSTQPTFIFFEELYDASLIDLIRSSGHHALVWSPGAMTLNEFIGKIARFSVIISNRFHGAISAALLGIPSITVGEDEKMRTLGEILPNSTVLVDLSDISWVAEQTLQNGGMVGNHHITNESISKDVAINVKKLQLMQHESLGG
jgi:polysaccharide pyruvyl transferase WcaK-like protein